MKKASLILIALLGFLLVFSGCKKEPEPFSYPMERLWGTWRVTHVPEVGGGMVDVRVIPFFRPSYFSFYRNGIYSKEGEYGDAKGTYTASGKVITCYELGKEDLIFEVISLSSNLCEFKVKSIAEGYTSKVRCKKLF